MNTSDILLVGLGSGSSVTKCYVQKRFSRLAVRAASL